MTLQRGCVQSTRGYRRLWSYPDDAARVCAVDEGGTDDCGPTLTTQRGCVQLTKGVPTTVVIP